MGVRVQCSAIHWLTQIHDLFDRLATCLYTNTSYFKPGNDPLSSGKGVALCSKNIRKGNTAFKFQNIVRTIVKVKCVGDRKLIIFSLKTCSYILWLFTKPRRLESHASCECSWAAKEITHSHRELDTWAMGWMSNQFSLNVPLTGFPLHHPDIFIYKVPVSNALYKTAVTVKKLQLCRH